MTQDEQTQKLSQLIAKCWASDEFKQRLMTDTAATLKAEGMPQAEGMTMTVVENTATVFNFVIPPKPAALADKELEDVAGGMFARTLHGHIRTGPFGRIPDPNTTQPYNPRDPNWDPYNL
jgi:hypothetical protein